MKKYIVCQNMDQCTGLPKRLIWQNAESLIRMEDAPPSKNKEIAEKNPQKAMQEIANAVHELESAKDGAVNELVIQLTTNPEFVSSQLLAALANRTEIPILRAVAHNTNTPKLTLRKLAKNPDCKLAVASNDNAPDDLLSTLSRDSDNTIAVAAKKTLARKKQKQ